MNSPPNLQPPDPGWKDVEKEINPEWRTATHVFAGDELLRPNPRFSILLATIENRAALFALLHAELSRQAEGRSVEILVACDAKQISIGRKRQNLLEQAKGDYVAFVDDDDWIAPDYVDSILFALQNPFDCVGFKIECTTNGGRPESAIASMRYPKWMENHDGYSHVRTIYHKTPVKRELALKVGFPDLRYGEDRVFSDGIMKQVATEYFIDKVLYFYRYRSENFAEKYGFPKGPTTQAAIQRHRKGVDPNYIRRPFHR